MSARDSRRGGLVWAGVFAAILVVCGIGIARYEIPERQERSYVQEHGVETVGVPTGEIHHTENTQYRHQRIHDDIYRVQYEYRDGDSTALVLGGYYYDEAEAQAIVDRDVEVTVKYIPLADASEHAGASEVVSGEPTSKL